MTDSEKQEKCRRIAEGLGIYCHDFGNGNFELRLKDGRDIPSGRSACKSVECAWSHCPDFYTDEAANAMLLEYLAKVCLNKGGFRVAVEYHDEKQLWWVVLRSGTIAGENVDRKTAICEAFLKMLEKKDDKCNSK